MRTLRLRTLSLALLLAACSQAPVASAPAPPPAADPPPAQAKREPAMCKEPRPQACAMIYQPVCATRDTGVRCITAPCPSEEQVTKSSGCNACSDPKVLSWVPGECPAK